MGEGFMRVPKTGAECVKLLLRRLAAEPDAQSTINGSGFQPQGFQHMTAGAFFTGGAFGNCGLFLRIAFLTKL